MESQNDQGHLSFLDVTCMNNGSGKYEFKVYRKYAITNVQAKPHSSINPMIVEGAFKSFVARAMRICSPRHLQSELEFLVSIFVENGHDHVTLERILATYYQCTARTRAA